MPYQPKGRTFDEFSAGETFTTASRTITEADVVGFAGISGDFNPLHTDAEFAKGTMFQARIAHGMLIASVATGLANALGIFEGTTIALLQVTHKFTGAVKFGDTVHMEMTVAEKKETAKPDRGILILKNVVRNQAGGSVLEGEWTVMMKRGPKTA